ncbi:MAG: hypothetical protein V4547_17195 [Bacteroidota bacterium]
MSNENTDKFNELRNKIKADGILSAEQAVIKSLQDKGLLPLHTTQEVTGKEVSAMSIDEKINAVARMSEITQAGGILKAAFDDCDLKTYIRFVYKFDDNTEYEITFLKKRTVELTPITLTTTTPNTTTNI